MFTSIKNEWRYYETEIQVFIEHHTKKMLFYFLSSIILVSSVSVYLSINFNSVFRKIDAMFTSSILLEEMQNYLTESEKNLALFIRTKDSESKNNYQLYADLLNENARKLKDILPADEYSYNIERLNNLIHTFTENASDAIKAKQGRDANTMREKYNYVHQVGKYIMEEINGLNLQQLKRNTENYATLSRNNIIVQKANLMNDN